MTAAMGVSLIIAAAVVLSQPGSPPDLGQADRFRPTGAVSAHATARIRIVSGVSFGPSYDDVLPAGASRRTVKLSEPTGTRSANLLEFQ